MKRGCLLSAPSFRSSFFPLSFRFSFRSFFPLCLSAFRVVFLCSLLSVFFLCRKKPRLFLHVK